MCPHCRQNAPVIYRGVLSYCTACGRPRVPLTGTALHMAGQPSKVGGSVARAFGWLVLFGGLAFALLIGALFQAIFPAAVVGFVLGGILGVASIALGLLLLRGGSSLRESGVEKERWTRQQALFALAANRGGMLTALDVSQALGLPHGEADAFMTRLAKEDPEHVRLEVDENGTLFYLFPRHAPAGARVAGPGVRVGDEPWGEEEAGPEGESARPSGARTR